MSPISVIPTPLAQRAAARRADAARNPRNANTVDLFHIAGRLGQAHRSAAYLVRTLDALSAREGFPLPFPVMRPGGLLKTAHRDSRWPRVAVDLWFDNRLPPAARGAVEQAERVEIDSRLSARAMRLFADDAA